MPNAKTPRTLVGAAIVVMLLAGCATQRDFYEQAVKTNIAVEEAHNRILLLNVIRGLKRQPMHFTGFAKITGPAGSVSPSFGFTVPFGPDAANPIYQFLPTIRPDVASYEIAIYDKQDFMRGFTTRVPPSLLEYFLDQGWPPELIMHVLVRTVDTYDSGGKLVVYTNQPQDRKNFSEFQKWIRGASLCKVAIKNQPEDDQPIKDFELSESNLPNGAAMIALQEKGYLLVKKKDSDEKKGPVYQLAKRGSAKVLKFEDLPGAQYSCPEHLKPRPGGKESVFHLRSPEAMVYYLGEVSRAQLVETREDGAPKPAWPIKITVGYREREPGFDCAAGKKVFSKSVMEKAESSRGEPTGCPIEVYLFNLVSGPSVQQDDVLLHVQHDGSSYGIPRAQELAGRSMNVLSLISQIIGMQKNATELPQSTTVRVIQ